MKFSKLGFSNIKVSKICLGTMTFGEQNTKRESFEIMDYANEKGVNFSTLQKCTLPTQKKKLMVCQKRL